MAIFSPNQHKYTPKLRVTSLKKEEQTMKKITVTRLCMLVLLMMAALFFMPKSALALTQVENGKDVTLHAGEVYTFTLPTDTETLFMGTPGLLIRYGKSPSSFDYSITLDSYAGYAYGPEYKGTYYFKIMSGDAEVSVTWEEGNKDITKATEFTLDSGRSRSFNQDGPYRYYLLNVTDPSAKYTFKTDNDVVHMDILPGKRTEYASAAAEYRIDQGKSMTLVLDKGYYTIAGISNSKPVQFTVTREKWVGITKITPSNNGQILGTVGTTFDYQVFYEPKNADAKISVKSASSGSDARMKLKSQSNGVAVFEVDFRNDEANKRYTLPFSNKETTRSYNRVVFSSENGVTATAEKMAGPEAPKLYGTMTGSTKSISIPVTAHPNANQFIAYVKDGSRWVKAGETKTNSNGIYYVQCNGLKAGKTYTFRVYGYADGIQGGYLEVKGVTAYNIKPTKAKAKAVKAKFVKKKRDYEWRWDKFRGWYKVQFTDYTKHTVKVTYKLPKKASGMYVTVNGKKMKSGKKLTFTLGGKTKAGKKTTIIFQSCRKSGQCIAYGPTVKVKCKLKAGK